MMIVTNLNRNLPQRYVAEPRVHLGSSFEIDVSAFEEDDTGSRSEGDEGGECDRIGSAHDAPSRLSAGRGR
jgi:hypothetical protein